MKKIAVLVKTGCRRSVWTAVCTVEHRHGEPEVWTTRHGSAPAVTSLLRVWRLGARQLFLSAKKSRLLGHNANKGSITLPLFPCTLYNRPLSLTDRWGINQSCVPRRRIISEKTSLCKMSVDPGEARRLPKNCSSSCFTHCAAPYHHAVLTVDTVRRWTVAPGTCDTLPWHQWRYALMSFCVAAGWIVFAFIHRWNRSRRGHWKQSQNDNNILNNNMRKIRKKYVTIINVIISIVNCCAFDAVSQCTIHV